MCWFRLVAVIFLAVLLVFGLIGLFDNFWTINVEVVTVQNSKFQATSYLQQYGYMDKYNITGASVISSYEVVTSAIKDFQRFAGIPATGELDDATIKMMDKPRCGVKDKAGDDGFDRIKRYAFQGSRWNMKNLTYRISKYPSKLHNKKLVDNEIARALKVWSDVTNLDFTNNEKEHVDLVHIDIRFEKGDDRGGIFGGQGRTLAHAFSPHCGSDAHFDDEEQWTVNEDQGINLFQVAAHEFGHSLGLDHSDEPNSIMAPFYDGYDPRKKLAMDDILSIQALYGRPNKEPAFVSHHRSIGNSDPRGPNLCNDPSIDALTIIDDGRAFAFKGDHYWEIEEPGIVDGPRKISEDWDGLPGNIDAAMTWTDRKTYFFKDDLVYRFKNQRMDSGYPKPIHVEFPGIPNDIGAAFVWSGNGKAYFFKGHIYWRYDNCKHPTILSYYPLQVNGWKGLPNNIDAAVLWRDQKTYFFKEDKFYRFNDKTAWVDQRLSTADFWLNCSSK